MLVMGLFAIIIAGTVPFLGTFQSTQNADTLAIDLTEALRRAQHRSITAEDAQTWGVHILSGSFILYAGTSYAQRVVSFDEIHSIDAPQTISGLPDIHFSARGIPMTGGTITLAHPGISSKSIQVNTAGGIFVLP